MSRDDPQAVDRLDVALDALSGQSERVGGGSPAAESWLDATDVRLRELDAAFAPGEGVLMRIWDGMVEEPSTAPAPVAPVASNGMVSTALPRGWRVVHRWFGRRLGIAGGVSHEEGGHIGPPLRGGGDGGAEVGGRRWRRRWSVAELSTVALLVVVLIAGYGAIRLAGFGGSDGGGRGPAGGAVGTPSPGELIVPQPWECTVEPRTLSSITDLLATPTTLEGQMLAPGGIDPGILDALGLAEANGRVTLESGEPADDEIRAGVTSAIHEWTACRNAGDYLRLAALYTDEVLTYGVAQSGASREEVLAPFASPTDPVAPEERIGYYRPREVRVIDEDHVAVVQPVDPLILFAPSTNSSFTPAIDEDIAYVLYVFERQDDRWLIDGFVVLPKEEENRAVPPAVSAQTPTPGKPTIPSPEECTVTPRSVDDPERLVGTPIGTPTGSGTDPLGGFTLDPVVGGFADASPQGGCSAIG